jgi:DNA-binding MarR family transcriptional regulator
MIHLMSKSNKQTAADSSARPGAGPRSSVEDITLERSLEGLFRLGTNRRFDARQSAAIGAVVTRAGYAVMRSLSDQGTISLGQVAKSCAMDSAAASRQVSGLIDEGLVDRRVSEEDARSVDLFLTDRGREVYESIVTYRLRHLASVLDDWDDDDRAVLAGLVARLVDDLTAAPLPRVSRGLNPTGN